MATIDTYKHKMLGFIDCPSTFDFVYNNKTRQIAIYQILEDIPQDEDQFDGKVGDIIIGGGNGEAPSLRISNPKAFRLFINEQAEFSNTDFNDKTEICKSFWTPTQSFIYCEGFLKLGWTVDQEIEMWLTENICKLLVLKLKEFDIYKTNKTNLNTTLTLTIPN